MKSPLYPASIPALALIIFVSFPFSPLRAAAQTSVEIPTLQWGDSKRPDGTVRHWNPEPLIEMGATLVCVAYRPYTENGERWFKVGMTPPKLLVKALQNTRPELELCHKHGIKVIGYADTIMFHPEMFQNEAVNPDDLYALDRAGERVINTVWDKSGAGVSCVTNPKWIELQKEVALITAQEGFDGLQFDVYPPAIGPGYLCRCQFCVEAWKGQSKKLFGSAQPMPGLDSGKLDYRNAIDREFRTWRLQNFVDFVKTVESHVQKVYPRFIIIMNHGGGTPDFIYEAINGALKNPSTELWHLKLGDDSSLYLYTTTEAANSAKSIGLINFADQRKPDYRYRVALAEAFAGGGTFYFAPAGKNSAAAGQISRNYSDFLRQHHEWIEGTRSDAHVAVLYSWRDQAFLQGDPVAKANVEFDPKRTHYQRAAAVLARMGVPHDCVIVEKGLNRRELSRYKVIVAPELSLVTEKDASTLKEYVRAGGHLLAIGEFGTVTESKKQFQTREKPLLATWTGTAPSESQVVQLGKGRIAFAPRATTDQAPGAEPPSVDPSEAVVQIKDPAALAIPVKHLSPEFRAASEAIGLSSQITIQSASAVECTIRAKENTRSIHLIRFGATDHLADKKIVVDYLLPKDYAVSNVSVWSPETSDADLSSSWEEGGGELTVKISRLENYALVGINLAPKRTRSPLKP
jgi:hypothetical protein